MVTRPFAHVALTRATIITLALGWILSGGHPWLLGGVIVLQVLAIAGDYYVSREVTP